MRRRSISRLAATGAALSLLATGCLSEGGGGNTGGGGNAASSGGGDKKVEVFGNFTGAEAKAFEASLVDFEKSSGIDVTYVGASNFAELIRSRVAGNNLPDIALFPQPGLLRDIAGQGKFTDLGTALDMEKLKTTLIPGLLDASTLEGKVYGVPMRMAVKSLVWHPAPEFQKAGYTAPKTHAELLALTDKIKGSGTTPWCIGMESGPATGWVATDWLEEYVLRIGGPETYDKWWKHEIPFNDPVVKKAAQEFEKIAFPEGNVLGGRKTIVSTPFGTSANPMFAAKPQCYLHRQGNFITSEGFFPKPVQTNLEANVDLFALPPVEGGFQGQPVLGGGDLAAMFKVDDDSKKVMEFIASDKFGGPWAKAGGWLSPHKSFNASQYPNDTTREIAKVAANAKVFRFDASDLMPGAVGSGSFWKGMVAWVSGQKDLDTALKDIEESWPKS